MSDGSYFTDPHFVDELIQLLVHDQQFLRQTSHLLTPDDFRRRTSAEGREREIVAKMALDFWRDYHQPIGKLIRAECSDLTKRQQMSEDRKKRLMDYAHTFMNGHKRVAPDLMLERVRSYRFEHNLARTMQHITEMIETGSITPEQFISLARSTVEGVTDNGDRPVDLFASKELEKRIARRILQKHRQRFPALMIDPIDRLVRVIAKQHLGLVLAPWKRGKTLFFIWLALAYALQGLNVLHFTLEDPREDIEDRFDAAITALPLLSLADMPKEVRQRFNHYKRLVRSRIKIVDGTDGQTNMARVESVFERERSEGWNADAILIDYDDEIKPRQKQQERRFELAEVYRDFRAVITRHNCIGWTASQTNRASGESQIVGAQHTAEDISKIRKAAFVLSLGKGEWGEMSLYLWVVAHRYDAQHLGGNILQDREKMLFYARDATLAKEHEVPIGGE